MVQCNDFNQYTAFSLQIKHRVFFTQVSWRSQEFYLIYKGWSMWRDITRWMASSCSSHQGRSQREEMDLYSNRRDFGQILDTLSWQRDAAQMDSGWRTTVEFPPSNFYKWGGQPSVANALKSCLRADQPQELLRFLTALSPASGEDIKQRNDVVLIDQYNMHHVHKHEIT